MKLRDLLSGVKIIDLNIHKSTMKSKIKKN